MRKSGKDIFNEKITRCISDHLTDPRSPRNQKHSFTGLICTSICAVLSGIDSFMGIQDFVEIHFRELSKYFDLDGGIPSHDTYRRLWNEISPSRLEESFREFIDCLKTMISRVISIDGKTIRNSGTRNPLHIVSAFCQNNQMVFCQEKVREKSSEILAIPKLLRMLDLRDKIITIDALGAQRAICDQIIGGFGDYVIALKGNQENLHEDVKLFFQGRNDENTIGDNVQMSSDLLPNRINPNIY